MIGGFTIRSLGSTLTFRAFALVAASAAVAYEIIHHINRCCQSENVSELEDKEIKQPINQLQEFEMADMTNKEITLPLAAFDSELEPLTTPIPPEVNSV